MGEPEAPFFIVNVEAKALDSDELANVLRLTAAEVITHSKAPGWTRRSVEKAGRTRT